MGRLAHVGFIRFISTGGIRDLSHGRLILILLLLPPTCVATSFNFCPIDLFLYSTCFSTFISALSDFVCHLGLYLISMSCTPVVVPIPYANLICIPVLAAQHLLPCPGRVSNLAVSTRYFCWATLFIIWIRTWKTAVPDILCSCTDEGSS